MNTIVYTEYLEACCEISQEAGRLIMGFVGRDFATQHKSDHSPVTDADMAANAFIVKALRTITPGIPIIAEENDAFPEERHSRFWLVDPLDGTRAFVRGEPEFTVNIGLIENGTPVLGVIYAPPQELLYFAAKNNGAFRAHKNNPPEKIRARKPAQGGLVVVKSKSHASAKTQAYLETLKIKELRPGSSSIKLCMVAEGSADIYPRFGRTMEWDTCAGHAILNEAGGRIETESGTPLIYGKPNFENPGFIAFGG